MISKWFYSAAALVVGAVAATMPGQAQTLGPIRTVASGDPFSKCTADNKASQPGSVYSASLIEPWIAADPTIAGHLLVGVQQDRWSTGGSRGLRSGVTFDGAKNWSTSLPQGVSQCTGGYLARSTDPWTAIDANGTAYFFSLAFNNNPSTFVNGESALYVSRSTDGGSTWQPPVTVIDDTDPLAFNDKNSMTADPTQPGYVYTVWDRLYGPPLDFKVGSDENGGSGSGQMQQMIGIDAAHERIKIGKAAAAAGAINPADYFGPSYFARSTDSGQTFERAVPIYDPGRGHQTIGNEIVVAPNGLLLDFFTYIDPQGNTSIRLIYSNDHGFSWSRKPIEAVSSQYFGSGSAVTPDTGQNIRQADIIFSVTVDPNSGLLALDFESKGASGTDLTEIFYSQSIDAVTWSTPIRINQTPSNTANPLRGQAFNMAVAAGANNTLVATYYDFRNDTGLNGKELADMWVDFCTYTNPSDCADPANWGREMRMTENAFDILTAPFAQPNRGYFLGDYFGLVAQGQSVYSAFTATGATVGRVTLHSRQINLSHVLASP